MQQDLEKQEGINKLPLLILALLNIHIYCII
jgi:hypothetical protein